MMMGEGSDLIKEIEALQDADERLQAAHNALIGITTNVINDLNDECWEYCCKVIREHFGAKEWQEAGDGRYGDDKAGDNNGVQGDGFPV